MTTHRCPGPGCPVRVPSDRYACVSHWYTIPESLRREMWQATRRHGLLSEQHIAAMRACGDYLRGN